MKRRPKQATEKQELLRYWFKHMAGPGLHPKLAKLGLDQFNQRTIDLVASNEPLTREVRDYIATELQRLYFPGPPNHDQTYLLGTYPDRDQERRAEYMSAALLKQQLRRTGMSATEAEQDVADELGLSVDALRQRLKRGRKLLRRQED
jgi:hypothetical protein